MKKKRKKMEFSKLLAIIVTILFCGCIMFSLLVWYKQDRIPAEILGYVATPFGVVVSGYFVKSGFENYRKISQYQTVTQSQTENNPYENY